jgi:leader peptidase (prepilin peptidase)/N-methyltransferase
VQTLSWVVWSLFVFAFGAAVGSFVNVVAWRLPRGGSIVAPPSRCPVCGARLSWRENLPVLGWILLRGRCRRCGVAISPRYLVMELLVGALFTGLFLLLYLPRPDSWWTLGSENWWVLRQLRGSWPGFIVLLALLGALVPITLIDARTYLIPIGLTLFIALVAAGGWALQSAIPQSWPVPPSAPALPLPPNGAAVGLAALGGVAGAIALALVLSRGLWRRSFHDYESFLRPGETLGEYPHARREALRELWHLGPIAGGIALGTGIGGWWLAEGSTLPRVVEALSAVSLGYLVGGGLVWLVRILGTLAFGREAMGLGDVHLLGAVGAALGWVDAVAVFLIAPFLGIAWAIAAGVLSARSMARLLGWRWRRLRRLRGMIREMPYGPHLAVAAVLVVFLRPVTTEVRNALLAPPDPVAQRVERETPRRPLYTPGGGGFNAPPSGRAGSARPQ